MKRVFSRILAIGAVVLPQVLPSPVMAQGVNGIVVLQENATIAIDGPLLGGQAGKFAQIVAVLHAAGHRHITIKLNSQGGLFDEANYIVGAVLAFQAKGGRVHAQVPSGAVCWSICPMIFSFADHRSAANDTSWMFHRFTPDVDTRRSFPDIVIATAIDRINRFWLSQIETVDPDFGALVRSRNWLADGREHRFTGGELRSLSIAFFDQAGAVRQPRNSNQDISAD